jgi:hypothetical protein
MQLPFQLVAVLPTSAHTYKSHIKKAADGTIPTLVGAAKVAMGVLPSSFVFPVSLPVVAPHAGPPPNDMMQLQQSLVQRGSMLIVLQGRNFLLTDHLNDKQPGLTLEAPENTTLANLLQMLCSAAESADPALRSFAKASGHAPARALWIDRGYWAAHVPGDVLDEEEGRLRKPGYFGLSQNNCGGGGGLMEHVGHFGMRLLDLGISRMHGVMVVADLRFGRPDRSRGMASASAKSASAATSSQMD